MSQKVLVTYGDGPGRTVIGAAEKVVRAVAPDLEICHGRIGADAYANTAYALPPTTLELASECDAMLTGPVDMVGINERNPLDTIRVQTGLAAEYTEFFPLCDYLGDDGTRAVIIGPAPGEELNIRETETLDGVTSDIFTGTEAIGGLFDIAFHIAEVKAGKEIRFVPEDDRFPIRDRIIRNRFSRLFAASEFTTKVCAPSDISYLLAHSPSSVDIIICGTRSAPCFKGQCAGNVGGGGLMPRAYIGKDFGMYMPSIALEGDPVGRETNPTSAILSAAVMLLMLGRKDSYRMVRNAVAEMYRTGRTTPDIGGKLNADKFADGVNGIIHAEILSN